MLSKETVELDVCNDNYSSVPNIAGATVVVMIGCVDKSLIGDGASCLAIFFFLPDILLTRTDTTTFFVFGDCY